MGDALRRGVLGTVWALGSLARAVHFGTAGPSSASVVADALCEARRLAVESHRPHVIEVRPAAAGATIEIRAVGAVDVLHRLALPGAKVLKAPEWIEADSLETLRLPFGFQGCSAPNYWGRMPPAWGDLRFDLGDGEQVWIALDEPRGRIREAVWFTEGCAAPTGVLDLLSGLGL